MIDKGFQTKIEKEFKTDVSTFLGIKTLGKNKKVMMNPTEKWLSATPIYISFPAYFFMEYKMQIYGNLIINMEIENARKIDKYKIEFRLIFMLLISSKSNVRIEIEITKF